MPNGMAHIEQPHEGKTNDWWTPPEIVRSLGEFDLDPCGGVDQIPLAKETYVLPQDGLQLPWNGRVWCNPPYGPHVKDWVDSLAKHGNGIMLIFARVETKAWHRIWQTATAILFPSKRITFHRPDGNNAKSGTAPSAFIAYGENNLVALQQSGMRGALITKWQNQ